MKKRALACLLLINIGLQPIASVLATEEEIPTVSSEKKATEETLERPFDTMTQELLESESTSEEEIPTETTDSIDEPKAPIDIEQLAPTLETLSAPRAVTTVPWGQTICTIEGDENTGYTITVRAGSGNMAGATEYSPWYQTKYKDKTRKIIFDECDGKIQLVGEKKSLFEGMINLNEIDFSGVDTSQVTNMENMFSYCLSLEKLDLSYFNTSNVTSMQSMFNLCEKLNTLNLTTFDTSKVTNMSWMFHDCNSLKKLDLSSFDTRQAINMNYIFFKSSNIQYLKLGSQTQLPTNCNLRDKALNESYTGKWTTVGNGTVEKPKGDWSGTVAELCARSQTGVADTYVWEPKFYTITFDVNGGANAPETIKAYKDDVIDLKLIAPPTPTSHIYKFIGWTTVKNNDATMVDFIKINNQNIKLYASWEQLLKLTAIPDNFYFRNNVIRNEYTSQIVTLNTQTDLSKLPFKIKWRGDHNWKLTVTMAEWRNPDDNTDTLTGVQMYMNNQLTYQDGSPAPSTIHSNQHVVLNAGETQTLVTTTAGNSTDGTGNWQNTIDFDSVKLKIPRYGGREGSYYTSQLTWSLDDTI